MKSAFESGHCCALYHLYTHGGRGTPTARVSASVGRGGGAGDRRVVRLHLRAELCARCALQWRRGAQGGLNTRRRSTPNSVSAPPTSHAKDASQHLATGHRTRPRTPHAPARCGAQLGVSCTARPPLSADNRPPPRLHAPRIWCDSGRGARATPAGIRVRPTLSTAARVVHATLAAAQGGPGATRSPPPRHGAAPSTRGATTPSRLDLGKKHGRHDNSTRRDRSQEGAPLAREHIPERAEAFRRCTLPGSPGTSSAARVCVGLGGSIALVEHEIGRVRVLDEEKWSRGTACEPARSRWAGP